MTTESPLMRTTCAMFGAQLRGRILAPVVIAMLATLPIAALRAAVPDTVAPVVLPNCTRSIIERLGRRFPVLSFTHEATVWAEGLGSFTPRVVATTIRLDSRGAGSMDLLVVCCSGSGAKTKPLVSQKEFRLLLAAKRRNHADAVRADQSNHADTNVLDILSFQKLGTVGECDVVTPGMPGDYDAMLRLRGIGVFSNQALHALKGPLAEKVTAIHVLEGRRPPTAGERVSQGSVTRELEHELVFDIAPAAYAFYEGIQDEVARMRQ